MADYEAIGCKANHGGLQGGMASICIIRQCLPDSCKPLRRLQELSVLTRLLPQATLLTVCYGFGERVPHLMVTDTQ